MLDNYQSVDGKTDRREINQFIQRFVTDDISKTVKDWYAASQNTAWRFIECFKESDAVQVDNVKYRYATNIESVRDALLFDAVVDSYLSALRYIDGRQKRVSAAQRLTIRCKVTYDEGTWIYKARFANHGDAVRKEHRKYPVDGNLVPVISKDSLDIEAANFIRIYCPGALETPQPVPIMDILKKMGLTVLIGAKLKNDMIPLDGQVFGQICFSPMTVEYECPETKEIICDTVSRGTVVIDPATIETDSVGCLNNTLAHEGFHWFRQRVYATVHYMLYGEPFVACRLSKIVPFKSAWTDEQWLEWQAKSVAPRILMPIEMFKIKANELFAKYDNMCDALDSNAVIDAVIRELADFFIVSRQSVRIRLRETGFIGQDDESDSLKQIRACKVTTNISMRDAFREYSENKEFRAMVDSGAICYVENHFVINDPIYVHETRGGLRLTAYGRRNLSECALNFTLRKDYPQPIKGIAFRVDRQKIKDVARYERDQNISSVLENIDELRQLHERFDSEYEEYLSITPSFGKLAKKIIEQKHLKNQDIIARSNLDQSTYSRLINDKVQPKLCTVAAFCFGIRSSKETSDKLFDAAGFAGSVSRDRFVYTFVLRVMKGRSIHECNAFLESKGVEIMGSQQRCEKHVVNE